MSKYTVTYKNDTKTFTIREEGAKGSKTDEPISFIVMPELGQIPDAQPHPEPAAHLRNLAMKMGINDFKLVTVVNKTGNERLDKFEQKADPDYVEEVEKQEEAKVDNPVT